jgi:hypothetical protein
MEFVTENYVTDILVEFNDNDYWSVSYGNYFEDDWSPILAEFYFMSDALEWALEIFNMMDYEEKTFVILDPTQQNELEFLSTEEQVVELIRNEVAKGN